MLNLVQSCLHMADASADNSEADLRPAASVQDKPLTLLLDFPYPICSLAIKMVLSKVRNGGFPPFCSLACRYWRVYRKEFP